MFGIKKLNSLFPAVTQEHPNQAALSLSVLVPVYNERHLVNASLRRLLTVESEFISSMEVIVVDDHSKDGSYEILKEIAAEDSRVHLFRHEVNQGKGAAIRTALSYATGDVCIIHDADLEYNPHDIPQLLLPFIEEGADAVFGSRYMAAPYHRVLMYRHTQINQFITWVTNLFTDLNLSDVETCYKAVKTPLLKSIPIRSNDFRLEVELSIKLAKRRARVFEVPIRYMPRSYEEGKKIRTRDGLLAMQAILHYWLIDDIYHNDQFGSHILNDLQSARQFNKWMGDQLRPFIGDRILELGAGIGNLTSQFIPRNLYVASDINETYLNYLRSYSQGKPYLHIEGIDAGNPEDFQRHHGIYDTVIMINLLEHVSDPAQALQNVYNALAPGGSLVVLVPQHPWLYGTLDYVLGHRERYTQPLLVESLKQAGLVVEKVTDFNRVAVPAWFMNARIFKKTTFSRFQLKVLEIILPLVRIFDRWLPWKGVSLIAIARKV